MNVRGYPSFLPFRYVQNTHRYNIYVGNILPDLNTAPALIANARELEKHMLADSLEQKIQNRPRPEDLISQGILDGTEDPRTP